MLDVRRREFMTLLGGAVVAGPLAERCKAQYIAPYDVSALAERQMLIPKP